MSLTMNDQPSEQSRNKAERVKQRLLEFLRNYSHAHAPVKSYRIQQTLHVSDIVVRQAIGKLRDDGHAIASGKSGFFLARNGIELQDTIDNITDRIGAMSRRRQLLLKAQDRLIQEADGQLTLI